MKQVRLDGALLIVLILFGAGIAEAKSPFRKVPRHPLKRGRRLGAVAGSMVFCRAVGITETADPPFRNGL